MGDVCSSADQHGRVWRGRVKFTFGRERNPRVTLKALLDHRAPARWTVRLGSTGWAVEDVRVLYILRVGHHDQRFERAADARAECSTGRPEQQ